MRIGIVCPYSWDVPGGVQSHVRDLAEALIEIGHEVSVISPADDDKPLPAYVVPAGEGLTAAECDKHCLAHPMLANFKRPRGYKFVVSLPRTATGKLMHYKLGDEARSGAGITEFERP